MEEACVDGEGGSGLGGEGDISSGGEGGDTGAEDDAWGDYADDDDDGVIEGGNTAAEKDEEGDAMVGVNWIDADEDVRTFRKSHNFVIPFRSRVGNPFFSRVLFGFRSCNMCSQNAIQMKGGKLKNSKKKNEFRFLTWVNGRYKAKK